MPNYMTLRPSVISHFDADGLIREVNLAGAQLLGIERLLLANKPFITLIADAEGREIFSSHLTLVLQQHVMLKCEIKLKGKDGTLIDAQLQSVAVDNSDGKECHILTSIVDGTFRKQLEQGMQNAHDNLKSIVNDRTGELTKANMQILQGIDERKGAEESLQDAFAEIKQLKDRLQAENIYLQQDVAREYNFGEIIGQSNAISYVFFRIEQVAPQDTTVLLLGETGTGKGVVARAIHSRSARKDRPMVTVNCTAMPANLIESELFGREKGAFTGADARQMGRFELADHGTIFLDEIGEMPLELQSKLLRVIQDGEFERLGSPRTIKVNVRIIAASNRNLEEEIRERQVPGRPLLPAQCFPHHDPATQAAQGRHPAARQSFCRQIQQENRQEDRDRFERDPERPPGIPLARQRAGVGKCHRAGGNHQPGDRASGIGPVRYFPEDRGTVRGGSQGPRRAGTGPHPPGAPENRLADRGAKRGSGAPWSQPQHPSRPDAEIRHPASIR